MYQRLNPVAAKLKARAEMKRAMLDARIALYMLGPGESCRHLLWPLTDLLLAVSCACDIQRLKDFRVSQLKGGMSAAAGLVSTDRYDQQQTTAINTAIDRALELLPQIKDTNLLAGHRLAMKAKEEANA